MYVLEKMSTGRSDYGTVNPSNDHNTASTTMVIEKERDALQADGVTWADIVHRTKKTGKPSTIVKKQTNVHTSKLFRDIILLKQSNK